MTTKISYSIALLVGLGMIFLGARFFFSPEVATAGYGIHFNAGGDYSFHHIKGIRDIFSGILLCAFVLLDERRAVGVTLLTGSIISFTDMLIVLSKSYNGVVQATPHIVATILLIVFGVLLLATKPQKKAL
ncbi:uncharacterized protein DUF4267 [Mucilaginibacter frigoritolerans]|uniref:Uncharacterized protein DUF4267 n=1 Tax=Mucilaginibacter frigoritolerans TaxID=652788 RepID=A0A562U6I6_9SPHI|nr:DUF4267 domain-containing protein [Mucilaginibacter frigoritolerans]TWJ00771.1 uncharacterized protein DUF4267 [Mucilaginibacter frigoritolerans]